MKFILTLLLVFLFEKAQADIQIIGGKPSRTSSESPNTSKNSNGPSLFSAGLIFAAGQGPMGNQSNVLNRSMIHTYGTFFFGVNLSRIRLGVNCEYNLIGQYDDPADYSDQNISGKASSLGARLDYYDGIQSFGVAYRFSDSYVSNKSTAAGTLSNYTGTSGYQVQYYRQIIKKIGFMVEYANQTYDDSLIENIKWERYSIGLIFTNFSGR
jgi:hypothetical protein